MFNTDLGECGSELRGTDSQFTQVLSHRANHIAKCLQTQAFDLVPVKKNRSCAHNPLAPRYFEPPPEHKRKSNFYTRALFRLKRFYYQPYEFLVHLLLLNPSYRKKRSQRREAISLVLQILVYYTDTESMEIKIPRKGRAGYVGISLVSIARMSGLSLGRVKNAIADLKQAQYLIVGKRINVSKFKEEGKFRSVNSFKKLTGLFWEHLGIRKEEIQKEKDYKKSKNKLLSADLIKHHIKKIRTSAKKKVQAVSNTVRTFTEKIPRNIIDVVAFKVFGYSH